MGETVIVIIGRDGTPTIEVQGHVGPGCKDITRAVEKALGRVVSDKPTAEMMSVKGACHVKHMQ